MEQILNNQEKIEANLATKRVSVPFKLRIIPVEGRIHYAQSCGDGVYLESSHGNIPLAPNMLMEIIDAGAIGGGQLARLKRSVFNGNVCYKLAMKERHFDNIDGMSVRVPALVNLRYDDGRTRVFDVDYLLRRCLRGKADKAIFKEYLLELFLYPGIDEYIYWVLEDERAAQESDIYEEIKIVGKPYLDHDKLADEWGKWVADDLEAQRFPDMLDNFVSC